MKSSEFHVKVLTGKVDWKSDWKSGQCSKYFIATLTNAAPAECMCIDN